MKNKKLSVQEFADTIDKLIKEGDRCFLFGQAEPNLSNYLFLAIGCYLKALLLISVNTDKRGYK